MKLKNMHVVTCPPCGESTLKGGKGVENKGVLFDNPPSALRATSPAGGEVNGGFTLIELLVVVLIIGILAAVALPQYQKAVEKSRATEAMMLLKNLRNQQALCFLEKGKVGDCGVGGDETNLLEWAQVEIPDTTEDDGCWLTTCGPVTRDFSYALDGSGLGLNIYAVRHPFATKYALITTADEEGSAEMYNQIACYNWDEDKNWCQVLGLPEIDSLGS